MSVALWQVSHLWKRKWTGHLLTAYALCPILPTCLSISVSTVSPHYPTSHPITPDTDTQCHAQSAKSNCQWNYYLAKWPTIAILYLLSFQHDPISSHLIFYHMVLSYHMVPTIST